MVHVGQRSEQSLHTARTIMLATATGRDRRLIDE
jgi:hypothetical protein